MGASSTLELPRETPTPGAPEKAAVRSMFDRIAHRYDLLNRLLSAGTDRRWRRAAVNDLGLGPQARILDLCTGTADLLIEALGRHPGRTGTGIDLSTRMLERGLRKLDEAGMASRAFLAAGDAERIPFASDCFDGALVAFGIRNVGDPVAALGEIRRVLRPRGRLVVLEFSIPRGPLGPLYRLYFENLAAMTPRSELASTRYCLAGQSKQGVEYVVYVPRGEEVSLDLAEAKGKLAVEWLDPVNGKRTSHGQADAGGKRTFASPNPGDAVLWLSPG